MRPQLVVFACGNTSRGDDALAPRLLERLSAKHFPDVTTIEDFQLQVEHALDLDGADLALFLDAGVNMPAPIMFAEVLPRDVGAAATHALEPAPLLAVYRQAMCRPPPPAFVLCVRGEEFGLGEGLSVAARERLQAAWPFLRDLCARPDVERWRKLAADFAVVED